MAGWEGEGVQHGRVAKEERREAVAVGANRAVAIFGVCKVMRRSEGYDGGDCVLLCRHDCVAC